MKFVRIIVAILLGYISYLAYEKGVSLESIVPNVDGAGIGITFLGLEMDDQVPVSDIPKHVQSFYVASVGFLVISLFLLLQPLVKKVVPSSVIKWVQGE